MSKKYKRLKVIQFNCGHGWEDVDETEDPQEAKHLLRDYMLVFKGSGSVKLINRIERL